MKKILSLILSLIITLTPLNAFASEENRVMEELLKSVKERIGDTEKYTEFNINSYTSNEETFYTFSWNKFLNDTHEYLNLTANADGIITSYNIYSSKEELNDNKLSLNRPKRAEALKIAQEFIDNINPEIKGKIIAEDTEMYESFRSDNYRFNLTRYENGYPVSGDTGRITLDKNLTPKSFNFKYTSSLSFESADNLISKADAVSSYNELLGAKLSYIAYYEENAKKPSAKLVYNFEHSNQYINAKTGEVVELLPYYMITNDTFSKDESSNDMASGGGSNSKPTLSPAELENLQEIEGLLSKEEIDSLVRANKYFAITPEHSITSSSLYYRAYMDAYVYSISYSLAEKNNTNLTIDAKTGEVISFSRYNMLYQEKEETPIDNEKLSLLSEEIITELAGVKAKEFKLADNEENSYYRNYTRYVNDIPFFENAINLCFDEDYNLTSYNINYYNCDFPSPDRIISKTDIFDIMSDLGAYQVYYVADYKNKVFVPVYNLKNYYTLDAFTGKSAYSYDDTSVIGGNYTDISGHWAENQIKLLSEYGIFFDGTELRPDDPITHKEYTALLSIVFYYNDISCLRAEYPADSLYASFPKNFLKDEALPDSHLTRSQAAVLMTRALGIEEYANLSGIYAPLYSDVSENIGAINILTGLGVVSGSGNAKFNPDTEISRAQALIMMYNYLIR